MSKNGQGFLFAGDTKIGSSFSITGNPSSARNKNLSHAKAQMAARKKKLLESGFFR
jgi:hypothetical protein